MGILSSIINEVENDSLNTELAKMITNERERKIGESKLSSEPARRMNGTRRVVLVMCATRLYFLTTTHLGVVSCLQQVDRTWPQPVQQFCQSPFGPSPHPEQNQTTIPSPSDGSERKA
ncbi:hypothetical protein ACN47E_006479 [Coniothyrium glycines]